MSNYIQTGGGESHWENSGTHAAVDYVRGWLGAVQVNPFGYIVRSTLVPVGLSVNRSASERSGAPAGVDWMGCRQGILRLRGTFAYRRLRRGSHYSGPLRKRQLPLTPPRASPTRLGPPDEIRAGWCADNSRIYATGLPSAAASSTPSPAPPSAATSPPSPPAWAPSFYTDHGGVSGQPCTPARSPLPVLEIHGGSDTDVPYAGGAGEGGTEPAIPDWLSCRGRLAESTAVGVGFPGVRQDGATPRQKKEEARKKKDSGGREKGLNECCFFEIFTHSLIHFEDVADVGSQDMTMVFGL
ncbi:hypothetical protein B0H14DRAFT_2590479 [Mycena olivaceomarginata]|nr:hypothetical protein B0H14DRAFT_2590479 [Mycena olivaceomarginata]